MGHTLARNGDGKRVSKKKERERDEGVGELESQVESSYCRHLHGHRPRVPTEPAHAWWGRGEGKVGRFRDGGRWYCRVEFERTVLRMEIRRRVPSSILLSSPPLSATSSPLPHPLPRLDLAASGPPFRVCAVFLSLPSENIVLRSTRRPALLQNGSSTTFLLFLAGGGGTTSIVSGKLEYSGACNDESDRGRLLRRNLEIFFRKREDIDRFFSYGKGIQSLSGIQRARN